MEQRTRVGAYVVCVRAGEVLLTRYTGSGVWSLPGGGIDHGEHPVAAAAREADEETGYRVEVGRLIGIDSTLWDGGLVHSLRLFFTGEVVGGTLRHEVDGSSDCAEWVPLAQVGARRCTSIVATALAAADLA